MNYAEASDILGTRDRKKVANNTYLVRLGGYRPENGVIALRLHNTNVLTFRPDSVTYDMGGWRTTTTKARFNKFGPNGVRVYSNKGKWGFYNKGEYVGPYRDGAVSSRTTQPETEFS